MREWEAARLNVCVAYFVYIRDQNRDALVPFNDEDGESYEPSFRRKGWRMKRLGRGLA